VSAGQDEPGKLEEPPGSDTPPAKHLESARSHILHLPIKVPFLEELHRRNVGRVALLYLGICWIVLEPVHVIFHMLAVPEWINRLVVVFMALGFPVAAVAAWVYEITPEGLKPVAANPRRSLLRRSSRRLNLAIMSVLGFMAVYFLIYHFWLAKYVIEPVAEPARAQVGADAAESGSAVVQRSIAVLPFVDMSQAKDQEYLSDGLAEELLNLLAQIPELRVAARTSAFAFKNKPDDISTIAKKLRVAHVLEGSVRKSGSRVRITVQLIRADSGYHLWSETYDRDLDDIFKLQDEIAGAVVQALKVALLGDALPSRPTPRNLDAYNLYLQGRYFADLHSKESLLKAVDYLDQAVKIDPSYEPTWTTLAFVYSDVATRGFLSTEEALSKARAAAAEAIKLDPKSARAHVALGLIHMNFDWDWAAADREFKQALAYDAGNATVLTASGSLELIFGRTKRAAALFQQAVARDALHASSYSNLGVSYYAENRLPEAEAAFRKSIELKPTQAYTHNALGLVLLSRGNGQAALTEMGRESDDGWRLEGQAIVQHALGNHAESDKALAELVSAHEKDSPYLIATVYAYRGQTELAFKWLDRAYAERDDTITSIKVDPLLKSLAGDPRYRALLKKLGLPE
jgi:adenylate cyclase